MVRVALYIRVSTEEQALHGLSVEAQTQALEDWAKEHRAQIAGVYIDAGLSARKPAAKRPELQRLLRDVAAKKIDLVVFTKLDRWFRNVAEYYKVQEVLEKHDVNWRTIHEDYDTSTASGRLKINIMLAVAQDEADRTSERIKAVFDRKKQRCEPVSGVTPLGYTIKDKKLVIDDSRAPIVKDLFNVYNESRSAYVAQRHLSAKHGIHYDISTVKRLLKNTRYKGEAYGIKDFCEPIIEPRLFDATQEIMKQRAQRNCAAAGRVYIFKGMLRCPECGKVMSAIMCKGIYYYRCTRRTYVGDCGFTKYIREDSIEKYLLANTVTTCSEYNINLGKLKKDRPAVDEAAIRRKMSKLKDLFLSDLIERDEYERDYTALRAELDKLKKEESSRPKPIDIDELRKSLDLYTDLSREEKRGFWSLTLDSISIGQNGEFPFTLRNT